MVGLKHTLEGIHGLAQLPPLAVELGLEPAWLTVNLGLTTPVVVVGRRAGFLAVGLSTNDPPRASRRVARALMDRGAQAMVMALDESRRVLSISATAQGHPVLTIGLDRIRAVDIRILDRGRTQRQDSAVAMSHGWAEALAGESLGERFFVECRQVLARGRELLPRGIPLADRHSLVLLNLCRVLFLYFVQERGWLDRRPRFLREELDQRLGGAGSVEGRFLRPLFFGTLNQPFARRSPTTQRFGRIPFLNGGLFEPHPVERRWRAPLPDEFWRDTFDQLFERYHFTVAEEDDRRLAIGPDMLGRVFEGVMDPEERSATGAFYTPSALVDQLVEEGLVRWLAAHGLGVAEARQQLEAPSSATLARLREITILDPAVGSGAFLMGALKRLVGARQAGGEPRSQATRAVIGSNLYGVDRNPNAVRLTELRLWLAVIQADPDCDPEAVAPLPNLDALVRQGDSLIEPVALPFAIRFADAAAIGTARRAVVGATGPAKRRAMAVLRKTEVTAARGVLAAAIESVEGRIRETLESARSPVLFGERAGMTRPGRAALARLRRERSRLRALERRLRHAAEVPWFHFQSHFGDVIGRGGFDLVVGNPPWVRAESVPPLLRASLKARYRWFRSSGSRGYRHLPDLSVAFVERALELLRPGGVVSFLVPAKLLTAQYAAALRKGLAEQRTLDVVAELDDQAAGFDALVYPLALVATKASPPAHHAIATALGPSAPAILQSSLGDGPWPGRPDPASEADPAGKRGAFTPAVITALRAATANHPRLADRLVCRLGVKTGADDAFLDPEGPVEEALLRPAVRGRDLLPFRVIPRRRILWTHDPTGAPLTRLPPDAAAHLTRHKRRLLHRADYRCGAWWMVFRIEAALARYRVAWSDLSRRLAAVALVGELASAVPLNTCYLVAAPNERAALALAAWLNSSWIAGLARAGATVAASGYRRFNAEVIGRLPLPAGVLEDVELERIGREAHRAGAVDQEPLDRRVAVLLGLDPERWLGSAG